MPEIELLPPQLGDLFPPLAGERQKLDDRTIRVADLACGADHLRQLIVLQNTVASDFLGRQRHAVCRRLIDNRSAHAPGKKGLDRFENLVGRDGSAALFNRTDEINDVALADFMNALALPRGTQLTAQFGGERFRYSR